MFENAKHTSGYLEYQETPVREEINIGSFPAALLFLALFVVTQFMLLVSFFPLGEHPVCLNVVSALTAANTLKAIRQRSYQCE